MSIAKSVSAMKHQAEEDTKSLKVMYLKTSLVESEQDLLIEHVDGYYYTIPNLPKLTLPQKIQLLRAELEQNRIPGKSLKPLKPNKKFIDGEGDESRSQEMTATDRFRANIEAMERVGKDMEKLKRIYSSVMKKLNLS